MTEKRIIKAWKGGRTFRPSIRLTPDEWKLIKEKAAECSMSVSDWMVSAANRQITFSGSSAFIPKTLKTIVLDETDILDKP